MCDILETIQGRRSVRNFTSQVPPDEVITEILEAGRWAPSGLNNQPWGFAVVKSKETREQLAVLTHYGKIIRSAPVLIAVFLDNGKTYDRTKDCLSVGACVQNMLLYIHSRGLGAVWLGEILKNKEKAAEVLSAPREMELMAVIALGTPSGSIGKGKRRPVDEMVFYRG